MASTTLSLRPVVIWAALLLVLRNLWKNWRSQPKGVKIISNNWLLGFIPSFIELCQASLRGEQFPFWVSLHRKHGRTMAMRPPMQNWWVVTSRPDCVEHILTSNFKNYPKGLWFTRPCKELLGSGIFNVDGEEWLHQRKTASHMFTAKLFKEHIWVAVQRNAIKLRDLLTAAQGGGAIDLFNFMNRFTLDTIGEIGFAKSIGSLDDPSSPFLRSFDRAQQITYWRFFFQEVWSFLKVFRLAFEHDSREHLSRLDTYSREVVKELRQGISAAASDTNAEAKKSFVGLFLQDAVKKGEKLSDDYLRDLVLNFLIAGRDTTAQALSWTIFCLCQHPEVEAKAREEIAEVCGKEGPSYDEIKGLKYVNAVLHEAMRLYPSVPLIPKCAVADDILPDGTSITAGTVVAFDAYGMARDREVWGEDAEDFKPERWLAMETNPDNYKYPVFNGGPRECLGRRLAVVEMKTCLAMLLPNFSFKLAVPPSEIKTDAQLTIGMGSGLPVFVVPVEKKSAPREAASKPADIAAG